MPHLCHIYAAFKKRKEGSKTKPGYIEDSHRKKLNSLNKCKMTYPDLFNVTKLGGLGYRGSDSKGDEAVVSLDVSLQNLRAGP